MSWHNTNRSSLGRQEQADLVPVFEGNGIGCAVLSHGFLAIPFETLPVSKKKLVRLK